MNGLEKQLQLRLDKRKKDFSYRKMLINRDLVDFCSNDYLGFARCENIKNNILSFAKKNTPSNGSTGSRLISGNSAYTESLETHIAQFHHAPAALLFNSGYDANMGLLGCLASRHDTIIYDQLAHASMREGIRLSRAQSFGFEHNNLLDLEQKLQRAKGQKIIAIESVYSMDGDLAPLAEIVELAQKHEAAIIVDEAHGLGVIGQKGEGLVAHLGLEKEIFARVYTYGKAMGAHGATVVGSDILRQYLINYARSFIFTTALAPHSLYTIEAAYAELKTTNAIQLLHDNIALFKQNLAPEIAALFLPSDTAIQCLLLPDNQSVTHLANTIQKAGFFAKAILAPTVQKGNERIRFCIHAFNTKAEILGLCQVLNNQ